MLKQLDQALLYMYIFTVSRETARGYMYENEKSAYQCVHGERQHQEYHKTVNNMH